MDPSHLYFHSGGLPVISKNFQFSQGSVKFGREIELSSCWIDSIIWSRLSNEQQNRAVRLQALLASAFSEHGRISLMVQGFQEGLDISPEFDSRASELYGNRNGFKLLRQRAGLTSGLQITDSDQLSLLVRSLQNDARRYVLMHSSGESYQQYRISARRFENQHRLFKDLVPQRRAVVNLVEDFGNPRDDSTNQELAQDFGGKGKEIVASVSDGQASRCLKCNSKRHNSSCCTTNLDKLKCFKCGQLERDCCSSNASSDANEENFDSDASFDANEEGFHVNCLFHGVLHFDMTRNDVDEFEFEEMSSIRNITDLEVVYNRNWSTAD